MPPDTKLGGNIGSQFYISSTAHPSLISQYVGFDLPCSTTHTLPDDVLLEIFDFYRLDNIYLWNHQLWRKLAHTCRRRRYIIFSPRCHLNLQLYCTYDTPITDMLSHSLPVPLVVNYGGRQPLSIEDERGRVDCAPAARLCPFYRSSGIGPHIRQTLHGPFPMLESLALTAQYDDDDDDNEHLCPRLPQTFQALNLRYRIGLGWRCR